jgi:hypothetical protein
MQISINPLIKPLFQYNQAVCSAFKKTSPLIEKIGLVIIAPLAYLALAFVALIGLVLDPLLSRVRKQKPKNEALKKVVDLSPLNGDLNDLSSFVHEIALGAEEKIKFNNMKYLYNKFIAGPTIDNCALKFQHIGDKQKMWSLIDSKGNNFSVLMDGNGKLFAQVSEYRKPLQILVTHL